MRSSSLQARFLTLFTVSTGAILLSLGGLSIYLMVSHLKSIQLANMRQLTVFAAAEVDHGIQDKKRLLSEIAESRVIVDYPVTYRLPPIANHLAEHQDAFPDISFINALGVEELRLAHGGVSNEISDYTKDPEFLNARKMPGIVSVVLNPDRDAFIFTLGIKRYFGDVFVGCLRAEVPLQSVSRHLDKVKVGDTGFLAIISAKDRLLKVAGASSGEGGTVVVQQLPPDLSSEPQILADANGDEAFYVAAKTSFLGISVAAVLPYDEFVSGPHLLGYLLAGVGAVFLLVGSGVAYLLGGRVSRPLSQLVQTVNEMAKGRSREIDFKDAPGEIGELIQSFNHMVRTLRSTTVSRDYLDNIFDSMHESLVVVGLDGRIERVNKATCTLLGYTSADLEGQEVRLILKDAQGDAAHWLDQVTRSTGHFRERVYLNKSGQNITVAFTWTRLLDSEGETCGLVCLAQKQEPEQRPSEWRRRIRGL
jgi:PAS domain S-box-containing protein